MLLLFFPGPYISLSPQISLRFNMPKTFSKLLSSTFFFLSTLLLFSIKLASAKPHGFSNSLSPKHFGLKRQKLSHLHFYFHDVVSGRNPTAIRVASAALTNKSETGFGTVVMVDDPLTATPDRNSKLVGKAQGIYASAAQDVVGLLMVMNLAFVEGKYNGSALSLLGRNTVFSTVREMPIVGGSGLFQFARGYAQAKTHTFNIKTGDAVVEYNVYVLQY